MTAPNPIGDEELPSLFAPLERLPCLVLAVSGGADSMALLHLVARWAARGAAAPRRMVVATVDHGLRPESRREAEFVAEAARAKGFAHEILAWTGAKPASGVQEAAREARYRLLEELAWRLGPSAAIVTAHHRDDQVETFLMRLARGSGLDGLAGMPPSRLAGALGAGEIVRPLLEVPKERLIATLKAAGAGWIEDPSNDNPEFERVRLRQSAGALRALGLDPSKIAASVRRLQKAREALEFASADAARSIKLDFHDGCYASLDLPGLRAKPEELRLRVLARLLRAIGGQETPPRLAKLESLNERIDDPGWDASTLGGCVVSRHGLELRVLRELGRSGLPEVAIGPGTQAIWDRRFLVTVAEAAEAAEVRALGTAHFAKLRDEAARGAISLPVAAAATLPAFWRGAQLIAVPHFGYAHRPLAEAAGKGAALYKARFLWS